MRPYDYVLVGGGLQNALVALSVLHHRPRARIALVEAGERLGGNHTWSFHDGDRPEGSDAWVEPLIAARWDGYDVRFPTVRRRIRTPLYAIFSETLHEAVAAALDRAGGDLLLGTRATELTRDAVRLADGRTLRAAAVVDATGPGRMPLGRKTGYQKFYGVELETRVPHGIRRPLLIDACVEQIDGFRFLYVLPFGPTRVLVEDTRFSEHPGLDRATCRAGALEYAATLDLGDFQVAREEHGVLPQPWAMPTPSVPGPGEPLVAGYGGGWFNPTTGYSFPVAARLADFIGRHPPEVPWGPLFGDHVRAHVRQVRFATFMNWLMFQCTRPEKRWTTLAHFYRRLPDDGVGRFYAMQTRWGDRLRLLSGTPPGGFSLPRLVGNLNSLPALTRGNP